MKKIVLLGSLMLTGILSHAQVLFYEGFSGIDGPTAGGAGTYAFPSGWFLRDVDNQTPDSNVAYVNEAWERREDFANNVNDSAAFSTSWYNPAGASDDWMWTPLIGPLPPNAVVTWYGLAYDPSFADGYQVRVMTGAAGPPGGGTGLIGNQVSASTMIFSTAAENSTWTQHTVSLNAYAGQSVYIAFRNNSNDKFLLLIDDVTVEIQADFDARITSVSDWSQYTQIPLNQNTVLPLSATINNGGLQDVTNVVLQADVYDQASNLVFTSSSAAVPVLTPSSSISLSTAASFVPASTGTYHVQYTALITETDQLPDNNIDTTSMIDITDSVYARDIGASTGGLGIGAGNGGYLGNLYVVTDTAILSSVSIFLAAPLEGTNIGMSVFNYNNGTPTTLLYNAAVDSVTSPNPGWYEFPVTGAAPLILLPDTYLVAAVEIDSTLSVGQTAEIFNDSAIWVNWPTIPDGTWTPVENFGAAFSKPFMIRANFVDKCIGLNVTATSDALSAVCEGTSVQLTASGGDSYLWDNGATSDVVTISALVSTVYVVTGYDSLGCADTAMVNVDVNAQPNVTISSPQLNNVECEGTIDTLVVSGANTYTWNTLSSDSMLIITHVIGTISWTVIGTDGNGCSDTATVNITSVNALPNVTAQASDDTVCVGNPLTLNGGGANTYSWTNGVTDGVAFIPSGTQTYIVTGTDASGCQDTAEVTVIVDPCTGIPVIKGSPLIQAYPNPGNGQFNIVLMHAMKIEVYDMTGKIIYLDELPSGNKIIDLTNRESGIYLLRAIYQNKNYLMKLTKE
jgi:hypothetical protein